jgi:hypothetical protein
MKLIVIFLVLASLSFAQSDPATPAAAATSASSRPDVMQLLELLQSRKQMEASLEMVKRQMKPAATPCASAFQRSPSARKSGCRIL